MARRAQGDAGAVWVQSLGEALGRQLGAAIAASMQRALQESIDVGEIAARLGAGVRTGRRGRPPSLGLKQPCSEPGCGRPVLAKDLCRSHYYKLRYKLQKEGKLVPKPRRAKGKKAEAAEAKAEAKKK